MLDEKDYKEIAHIMQTIVDADVTPKFNLLADEIQTVNEKLDRITPGEDIETLEIRVDALERVVKSIKREIAALKQAN